MKKQKVIYSLVFATGIFLIMGSSMLQQNIITPDLKKIVDGDWQLFNRTAKIIKEDDKTSVYFEAKPGGGGAWQNELEFTNCMIECDIKGKNAPGRSFVGIAFRGVDEKTYDAVYFRPFNFKSDDPARRSHGVQYISHPANAWRKLRTEHPNVYENAVDPVPDPDAFFHVRLVIEKPKVSVYVNDAKEPCLVVDELTDRKGGWVGLWMGNNSDGTFANLKIEQATKKN
jgi:hypothetical protein